VNDEVDRPKHYITDNVECIEAIESFLGAKKFRGYCLGQVMKYVWRAGKKDDYDTDLKKAKYYLVRAISDAGDT
jgi:hypothetical protein